MIYPRGQVHFWLCDPMGRRLRLMSRIRSYTYSRVNPVSSVGSFTLNCGSEYDDLAEIASIVEVWRSPLPGMVPRHEGSYILEKFTYASSGQRSLGGDHVNKLLKFRIVDAYKETAEADKSGPADDIARAYVREQVGALVSDPDRDFNNWFPFEVEPNYSLGPTLTKEASRAYVLDTVQSLVKAAAEHETEPTYLGWEVANKGHDLQFALQFRMWADYRGLDRSLSSVSPLILSLHNCLTKIERERDHGREMTRMVVGGGGSGANRTTVTVRDANRESLAPWWRREGWTDGGEEIVTAVLEGKGGRKLRDGRPVDKFKASLRPHPSIAYGVNLDQGDKVGVEFGRLWDARVESVTVSGDANNENIDLKLEVAD
jgi:hypothetical protein